MSITNLLTEPVTIHRHASGDADPFGNLDSTWTPDTGPVFGRLEQRSSVELTQDRQTVQSDWVLFLPPSVVIGARDRIADRFGRLFEVVGAPAMQSTPRYDSHIEASMRFVDAA